MGKTGGTGRAAALVGAVAMTAGVLALGACRNPAGSVVVSGRVTQSPGCGVVRPGQVCPNPPVAGEVGFRGPDGSFAARVHTGADGRYRFSAIPGNYVLAVDPDGDGVWPQCPDTPVVVGSGPLHQDVICGSGIR